MDLRPYQADAYRAVMRELETRKSTLVVIPTGGGKCLGRGTPVLKFDGTAVPVEEICVGDELMGPDSSPRRVLSLARGHEEMYRVVPTKGDAFTCNGSHVLTLIQTNTNGNPKCACQSRAGNIVDVPLNEWVRWSKTKKHIHKLFRVPVEFDDSIQEQWYKKFHVHPYLMGVLLGDGSFRANLTLTTMDQEVVDEVSPMLGVLGIKLGAPDKTGGRCFRASVRMARGNRNFRKHLWMMELDGALSGDKFIPRPYLVASRQDRLEMLAGLMDTDGSATRGGFDYISKSERLSRDVAFLSRSVGLAAYMRKCQKFCQTGGGGTYWRVSISGDCQIVPCRIRRKKHRARVQKKSVLRTGFKVEPIGVGEYFGFTISGDGRFLLGDFTVTHNTVLFAHVAHEFIKREKRVLVLAHRGELLDQAAEKLRRICHDWVDYEKADKWADQVTLGTSKAAIIVSSVQTQVSGRNGKGRMTRFDPREFGLIIRDEAHRTITNTDCRILDYYMDANPDLKLLGVTATPDRLDGRALGNRYESCAYRYECRQAIADGWLVPIRVRHQRVDAVNLKVVKICAGDFSASSLEQEMLPQKAIEPVALATHRETEGRKTIVFCPGVTYAEKLSAMLNTADYEPGCARVLTGKTPEEKRRDIISGFRCGEFRILCNVAVATEGFDVPDVGAIVMARPTKSRLVFSQALGRGMRPLAGVVDDINNDHPTLGLNGDPHDTNAQRRNAIAASDKPDCLLIDLVFNSDRHDIVCAADVLAGEEYDPDVVAKARSQEGDVEENLKREKQQKQDREREEAERLQKIREKAKWQVDYQMEDAGEIKPTGVIVAGPWMKKPPTPAQVARLNKWRVPIEALSRGQASAVMTAIMTRFKEWGMEWREAVKPFIREPLRGLGEFTKQKNERQAVQAATDAWEYS